jgi:formylglycine-generating enzyme required for sulfatase activity
MKTKLSFVIGIVIALLSIQAAQSQPLKTDITPMVTIPAGIFKPFFKNPGEPESVRVERFEMDATPVTNEQFLVFVKARPEWRKSRVKRIFAEKGYLEMWESDTIIGNRVLKNSPVTSVSWFAAKAYADWAGKQLPTIAQWEMAAATPEKGKTKDELTRKILDWYAKPNPKTWPPVKSTFKNALGLYDMHGLVWEWTLDFNSVMISQEARSKGDKNNQLFCGAGAVNSTDFDNYAAYMRYAFRGSISAKSTVRNLGFRCVKNSSKTVSLVRK